MIDKIKTVSKETLIYGLGNAAGSVISLLLLPLYTKYLTPAEFGYLSVLLVVQSVVEMTAVFGLSSALFRYYLMAPNEAEKKIVMNTCFWVQALFVVVVAGVSVPFSGTLSWALFGSHEVSLHLVFVMLTGVLSAFGALFFSLMRAEQKSIQFAIAQVVKITLLLGTNIYMVAVLQRGYAGIILGNVLVNGFIAVILVIWFARYIDFSFSHEYSLKLLRFAGPIYVVNGFFFVLNLSDRFFLNHFLSPAEVGLYSFGNRIGSAVMIGVVAPFSTAIVPYAMSIAREEHFPRTFAKLSKYFVLLLSFLSVSIFYFSNEIIILISNVSYLHASGIVGPILLSSILYGLFYNLGIAIDIVEKTYLATAVVFAGALVSLGVNYLAIPVLGIYGSALASCLSNAVLCFLMYYVCQKHYPIPYEVGAFLKLMGILIVYVAIYYGLTGTDIDPSTEIVLKSILCIAFPVVLFVFRVFDEKERQYGLGLLRSGAGQKQ
ncbi:MAG TPA: oligosaccharide flippase family protein [Bacteroidota bacterium]